MLLHMLADTVDILKITHMAQLVDLVITDSLDRHGLTHIIQICLRGCNRCNTGSRKCHLGGRAELKYHIRMSCLLTFGENL